MLSQETKRQLAELADSLDSKGFMKEANMIDGIIKKAQIMKTAEEVARTLDLDASRKILDRSYLWLSRTVSPEELQAFKEATEAATLSQVLDMVKSDTFTDDVSSEFMNFLEHVSLLDEV